MTYKYRITIIESERGWGRSYSHEDYNTRAEAEAAIKRINSLNTSTVVPDYYEVADSRIEIVEVTE